MRQGCESDFELLFAGHGVWVELLRPRSSGFLGTELKLVAPEERRYEVRDLWRSHSSFEVFRHWYQADLEKFREWLASKDIVEHERFVSAFYSDERDEGDEAGLIPA